MWLKIMIAIDFRDTRKNTIILIDITKILIM